MNELKQSASIEIVSGVEGPCLLVNEHRVAGPKPWGGGTVIQSFEAKLDDIERAIYGHRRPELIEDVPTFQAEPNKLRTNADRIRSMSDEELAADRIEFNYNPNGADYYSGDFGHHNVFYNNGVMPPEAYQEALQKEIDWLQQPAEGAKQ